MESRGELTIEGCVELAWLMGFIKNFDGRFKDGLIYVGWVDVRRTNLSKAAAYFSFYLLSRKVVISTAFPAFRCSYFEHQKYDYFC